ncbi:molecular chaperone SurA [Proteobacteria bacterium 005FR1]|nr:molecular chaperone SurA [Proteobacteria bacterium 005FR1]
MKSLFHFFRAPLAFGCVGVALVTAVLGYSTASTAETVTIDRVAAIVDDDVVMQSELDSQVASIAARMRAQGTQLPPLDVLRAQVLEHLVVQQLQLQIAERAKVSVEEAELDEAIEQMRTANNLSPEQFEAQLAAEGLTVADLRENVRREITINRVQRGVLNNRIEITEHDIDSFLASKEGQFWNAPDYHIGHILIPASSSASQEEVQQAQKRAQDVYERLQNGEDFAQLATTYSAGQFALQGGDWGWRQPTELPELFAQQLTEMKVGDVSEPFRSGAGFHLLKIKDQRGGQQAMVEQTKVRHILLKPSAILSEEQAQQKLLDIREKVLAGADFGPFAKENSDDIGSKLSGGDLGWSLPGQFVPQFEQAMNRTDIGEVSMPFRSEHGWHILMVEDRREQDMSERVKRNQARNLLRNRRFEEELPVWLQEIRDEAYVEVKLPGIDLEMASGNE